MRTLTMLIGAAVVALVLSACGARTAGVAIPQNAPVAPDGFGPDFYGINYDYAGAAQFAAANAGPLLTALAPGTLRWPGGTEADYFDWRTGKTTQDPKNYSFTLADLAAAHRATGAVPIFDLNVMAPGNRLDTTDQVAMLHAAQSLGLPVKYVEIGNELYGGGAFQTAFPDGTAYGKTVAAYVQALHTDFPGVLVAADGCLNPANDRERQWNSQLLATATGAGAPDAIVLHDYPGVVDNPFTAADLPPLFAGPYTATGQLTAAVRSLRGKPVWLTEYNFRGPYIAHDRRPPNPVQTSYAHELYLAELALMLPRVDQVTLVDNWSAFGGPEFSAWANPAAPALTPGGQAVELVDTAAHGATTSTPIPIPGAPSLPGGYPAVTGQTFGGAGGSSTSVLVNLSADPHDVPTDPGILTGERFQQISGDPTSQLAVAGTPASGTVGPASLRLPAYSITVVTAR